GRLSAGRALRQAARTPAVLRTRAPDVYTAANGRGQDMQAMRSKDAAPATAGPFSILLLLALALALVACRADPTGQLPAPSGEAIQAERAGIEGFGLARAWADDRGGGLSLALEFSQPLVPTQDFDRLITLDGSAPQEGGWALDEDNRTLRFPNAE